MNRTEFPTGLKNTRPSLQPQAVPKNGTAPAAWQYRRRILWDMTILRLRRCRADEYKPEIYAGGIYEASV